MFISRKKFRQYAEELAVMTVMAETLMESSVTAQAQLRPLLDPGYIMSRATFKAIDEAAFELQWSSGYVAERLQEMGLTVSGKGM